VTIASTNSTAFTLSLVAGIVNCDYLNIQNSTATGGAKWYAGPDSQDLGNNTGWSFAGAPAPSTGLRLIQLGGVVIDGGIDIF
jgi:hypothetical protein